MQDNAVQEFETNAEKLLVLMFAICEGNVADSTSSPQPSHDALCAAALSLQESIKAFLAAVRAA